MKVQTIAAKIVESDPGKYGQKNYDAAVAAIANGCPVETEETPALHIQIPHYDPNELLDLSLIIDDAE